MHRPPRNLLGRILTQRRWSDGDLARRAGLSRAHVNRVRNRRIHPTLRGGLLMSVALAVAIETIFHLDES